MREEERREEGEKSREEQRKGEKRRGEKRREEKMREDLLFFFINKQTKLMCNIVEMPWNQVVCNPRDPESEL